VLLLLRARPSGGDFVDVVATVPPEGRKRVEPVSESSSNIVAREVERASSPRSDLVGRGGGLRGELAIGVLRTVEGRLDVEVAVRVQHGVGDRG
jgi:hypothetical protein